MNDMANCSCAPEASAQPVAIVGYGAAGVNAVIGLRTAGYAGPIQVFSETTIPPYSPILTSYYAGGEKTYDECFPWSAEALADLDFSLVAGSPVVAIDPASHTIRTAAGEEYPFSKCVIATGARPTTVGFPEVEGYDPLVLRTMDDAERLRAALTDPVCGRVLVSGASMIALKCVEAALNRGKDVSMVGVNPHVLDFSALPVAAERFERGLAAKGVTMRFGQTIVGVRVREAAEAADADGQAQGLGDAENGALEAARKLEVTFSGGDVETYDAIIVAHGVRSDLHFIEGSGIATDRAILVDDFMRTSAPDIYAAGDVAQARELVTGEQRVLGIWKTAALQGEVAGRAIAAELAGRELSASDAYSGAIMTNTIAVNGTLFISAGLSQVEEGMRVDVREGDDMTVACIFEPTPDGDERLVGFNVVSDVDEPGGVAYDTGAMLTLRIEGACCR